MFRSISQSPLWAVTFVALSGLIPTVASAAEPTPTLRETREFEVLVKGKPQGFTRFKIEHYPDRRMVVATDAEVRVNLVVYVYTFEFHGSEVWVDNRMERFNNHGADGGKKYAINGVVQPGQSQLLLNGKPAQGPPFVMTSNYWRLPMLRNFNEVSPVVDASTGELKKTRINRGVEGTVELNGVVIPCTEFRITGDVDVKLWLDRDGYIVRQESVESGYPTEMRLVRISRENGLATTR